MPRSGRKASKGLGTPRTPLCGAGKSERARLAPCAVLSHAFENPVAAAVQIVHADDVGAGVEQLKDRADRRHSRGEGKSGMAALQLGEAGLERVARRIARARVVVALVSAGTRLRVGRGGVDRGHHRAGLRVGLLPGVNHLGLELHFSVALLRSQLSRSMRVMRPRNSPRSTTIANMPRLMMSISF